MPDSSDRELGMDRTISRRDFISGAGALGLGALMPSAFAAAIKDGSTRFEPTPLPADYYPPALTGMRGSGYESAYAVGHQLRDKTFRLEDHSIIDTGETLDLIVVGTGISGLAAAHYFRKNQATGDRVLLLDNHDDFGGHAKRNEFTGPDGRTIISNAGTFDLSTDGSMVVADLLTELDIDLDKLVRKTYDREFYFRHGMGQGVFFDRENFGVDKLMPDPSNWLEYLPLHAPTTPPDQQERWRHFMAQAPMNDRAKKDLYRLYNENIEYLPGLTPAQREQRLRSITYREFLLELADCDPQVVTYLRDRTFSSARGLDGMTAFAARRRGMPGFDGMDFGESKAPPALEWADEGLGNTGHAIYHFPDGNATLARLLVRRLIPGSLPGTTVEDSITARLDYSRLDRPESSVRLRLNSTVVNVRHRNDHVEVIYSNGGKLYRARAPRCILACWHSVIPHICPELPEWQKEALAYQVKAPNLWVNVWLRNWKAFKQAGTCFINAPNGYFSQIILEHPLTIGDYQHATSENQATKLTMLRGYNYPGLSVKDQYRQGRTEMFATTFETFEREVRQQLQRMLGDSGFNAADDILGITVNRWGHGYAYMYSNIYDEFVARGEQPPHQRARQRYGRITIANTDAAGIGSTGCAIDQAHRAVVESLSYDSLNIFY